MPDGEIVDSLGTAAIARPGKDATILALALMVPRALEAAQRLKPEHGIDCEVIDVRSLVPLDTQTILGSVGRTHRVFTVEENPRLCGWGAEIVSIIADEVRRSRRSGGADHDPTISRPPISWKTRSFRRGPHRGDRTAIAAKLTHAHREREGGSDVRQSARQCSD